MSKIKEAIGYEIKFESYEQPDIPDSSGDLLLIDELPIEQTDAELPF